MTITARHRAARLWLVLAAVFALPASVGIADTAFPGAVGYGREAVGWRGGRIVRVTTLNDDGAGSFRACAEADGPRVCVFDVSGTIGVSRSILVRSQVYIAGQTAPGDGIQLRLDGGARTPLVVKNAEDVVIRYLKVRPGAPARPSPAVDAVTVENARRVYLDHLSMAFATDETFNVHASRGLTADITLANSLLAYSLDHSTHPKGRHSKGALICSHDAGATGCGRVTLWRNLFAHHRDRNPDVKATDTGPVEVVNNVFYNAISQFGEYYNLMGATRIVHVGNVTLPGPSTIRRTPPSVEVYLLGPYPIEIAAHDNIAFGRQACRGEGRGVVLGPQARTLSRGEARVSPGLPVAPAGEMIEGVLSSAGDVLHRDALDARAVESVRTCTGQVIDAPAEAGHWPDLSASYGPKDSDADGLPDAWERGQAGLDPDLANDPWALDPETGLSRIEVYLATRAGDI